MNIELNEDSERIDPIIDINIELKDHQLAMIKKCIDIENLNICNLGIMNDKPGTGKTYAILGLIYFTKLKKNIIVVPQNIINQWAESIYLFSDGKLNFKKIINYSDILDLYNDNTKLFEYDILLTTSLYYNAISTTMKSNFLNVERVFFDEVDSISSLITNEINSNFTWFVSASFSYKELGVYTLKIEESLTPYIICKCDENYVDSMFKLHNPNVYRIICKNIYFDNIFNGLFTKEEFNILNAMDYSKLKRKFCNFIAQNEKEAIEYLVKDKLDIIDIEKLRIEDINIMLKNIEESNDERIKILEKQKDRSENSIKECENILNLVQERLKNNNCCPICYYEFNPMDKKVLSNCCQNTICFKCADNWFNEMKKEACIYCNMEEIKFDSYIVLNPVGENLCVLCEKEYLTNDDKYYSSCCKKNCCKECLKEWYHKLLKTSCLFCETDEILFEDFKNDKEHEEMRLNEKSGVKYTKKTKLEFLEYFIRTKYFNNSKIIFCSNYIKIFNNIKNLLNETNIKFIELDDGNINSITNSLNEYNYGNINILLLNSNLFGCGLNLQCTTDILFLHKTDQMLEKQIIGRAQRPGRKNSLNIWYLEHENESAILTLKPENIYVDNYFDYNILDLKLDNEDNEEQCSNIYNLS